LEKLTRNRAVVTTQSWSLEKCGCVRPANRSRGSL
jgi:hypothetical protein